MKQRDLAGCPNPPGFYQWDQQFVSTAESRRDPVTVPKTSSQPQLRGPKGLAWKGFARTPFHVPPYVCHAPPCTHTGASSLFTPASPWWPRLESHPEESLSHHWLLSHQLFPNILKFPAFAYIAANPRPSRMPVRPSGAK